MKNKFFTLLSLMTILLVSCSKDPENYVIGTWNADKSTIDYYINGEFQQSETITNSGVFKLKRNGTGSYEDEFGVEKFDWGKNGDVLTLKLTNNLTFNYYIIVNEKNKQVWTSSIIDDFEGTPFEQKLRIELSRK
jgi:outer membrane biogenesis lipoprotein LolB